MPPLHTDSTRRFSDRVKHYVRYRPTYPAGVLDILRDSTGLAPVDAIADIGSGTGISAELFLKNGNTVFGVEPNAAMRQAAETVLQPYPTFHSVAGTAESTTLPSQSVDYVLAAQAFHWFDANQARQEFARILRPGGWQVLIWNSRRIDSTPFLRAYESLLQRYGTDYREVRHKSGDREMLRSFFTPGTFELHSLDNEQRFDFVGLKGRLLSSSYTPNEGHPNCQSMLNELARIFSRYEDRGCVCIEYDTQIYLGRDI